MDYPERFKQGFIKYIEKELNKCEIIYNPNTKGIWFVNREKKYWYLEYKVETNYLWWRYDFFKYYMTMFTMESEVFQKLISEWVENKLNGKVDTTVHLHPYHNTLVEETLNCKVDTTNKKTSPFTWLVDAILNCKVDTTTSILFNTYNTVDDILNCKVDTTSYNNTKFLGRVEETLNCKVLTTNYYDNQLTKGVEETLNCKVNRVDWGLSQHLNIEDTLNINNNIK